jgi:hypothetical protein
LIVNSGLIVMGLIAEVLLLAGIIIALVGGATSYRSRDARRPLLLGEDGDA